MYKRPYIRIKQLEVSDNTLVSCLEVSKEVVPYLYSDTLTTGYDMPIADMPRSILQIPAVSTLVMLAWTIGADVFVDELDETFLSSLRDIKTTMHQWYPKLSFSTEIHVDRVVANRFSNTGSGLLFTGGVDSTASFVRNRDKAPALMLVRGLQARLSQENAWDTYERRIRDFAVRQGVTANFVRTNLRDFVNEGLVNERYGEGMVDSWWVFRHSISTLGVCAPLTMALNVKTLIIAATFTSDFERAWGSHPSIDEKVSWADVTVRHDGFDLSRQDKIGLVLKEFMGEHIEKEGEYPFLQICNHADLANGEFACNRCDKCLSAITGLALVGIDPNRCGFHVDEGTFPGIKRILTEGKPPVGSYGSVAVWQDIQSQIPHTLEQDIYGSREFFQWFRDYNFSVYERNRGKWPLVTSMLYPLYRALPPGVRKPIRSAFKR